MSASEWRAARWGFLFIAPALIGLLVFYVGPMLFSLVIGFFEWDMIREPAFVGAANYMNMFTQVNSLVPQALRVTLSYSFLTVPLITCVSLFLAVLLNTKVRCMSLFRTIFYIPSIVPAVANAALWMFLCNPMFGLLNTVLKACGLPPSNWIYDANAVIPTLSLMAVWGSGNTVIIYLAGLQGISRSLYESVEIDGGNALHKFKNVTVPMISPVIFYNMIMAIINCMQTFTQAYIMTDGGPSNASLFYVLLLYRTAFNNQQMGYASAMAWILFILVALLTMMAFKLSGKWVFYEGGSGQ
ncbi:carbohydrate ABC transporter permease [Bacillota bacterium Meth-B3]